MSFIGRPDNPGAVHQLQPGDTEMTKKLGRTMKRTVTILASAMLAATFTAPQVRAAHVVERIIARVNSEIITQRQYEREKAKLRDELAQQYSGPELEAKVK